MSPTEAEHQIRAEVVARIEKIILSKWSEAKVEIFGSYRTGLYLPTSDIDLVVIGEYKSHVQIRHHFNKFFSLNILIFCLITSIKQL